MVLLRFTFGARTFIDSSVEIVGNNNLKNSYNLRWCESVGKPHLYKYPMPFRSRLLQGKLKAVA